MSGKLDQSLDDILKTRKQSGGRPARRAAAAKATAAVAPVGGVKKNTKAARPIGKIGAIPSASAPGESKIIVSNLVSPVRDGNICRVPLTRPQPSDVNETQIKVCLL